MTNHFELLEFFDIDNGSLDNVNQQMAFCLGVEWKMFLDRLSEGQPFQETVISDNTKRLCALAERNNRYVESSDLIHGWSRIIVGGQKCD